MHGTTKKRFNKISDRFIKSNCDLSTIRWMINEARNILWDINEKEFGEIMNIPKKILKDHGHIENYELWKSENKSYLLENLKIFDEEFFIQLKEKINLETYSIEDMVETIEYIVKNFNCLKEKYSGNLEAALRNIEFAFRSLKVFDKEKLILSKEIFYKSMKLVENEVM